MDMIPEGEGRRPGRRRQRVRRERIWATITEPGKYVLEELAFLDNRVELARYVGNVLEQHLDEMVPDWRTRNINREEDV